MFAYLGCGAVDETWLGATAFVAKGRDGAIAACAACVAMLGIGAGAMLFFAAGDE
jgi:uncharacterized protein HemX